MKRSALNALALDHIHGVADGKQLAELLRYVGWRARRGPARGGRDLPPNSAPAYTMALEGEPAPGHDATLFPDLAPGDRCAVDRMRKMRGEILDLIRCPPAVDRLSALLSDILPGCYEESRQCGLVIRILANAALCGACTALVAVRDGTSTVPLDMLLPRWIDCLCNTMAMSPSMAMRAIRIWAAVFDITLPDADVFDITLPDSLPGKPEKTSNWTALAGWPGVTAGILLLLAFFGAAAATDAASDLRTWLAHLAWPTPSTTARVTDISVPTDREYDSGSLIEFRVRFNRRVAVTGGPVLPLLVGGRAINARYDRGTGTDELVFVLTSPESQETVVGITLGHPARINLAGGSIIDTATGGASATDLPPNPNLGRLAIRAAQRKTPPIPRATAMRVDSSRIYQGGDTLSLTIAFSRPLAVSGEPKIGFTWHGQQTKRFASFQQGDGTAELTFAYVVADRDLEATGIDVEAAPAISLGAGAIVDADTAADANLDLQDALPANLAMVRIDTKPPRIRGVEAPPPSDYQTGDMLSFALEFDEPVRVVGSPMLELRLGDTVRRAAQTTSTTQSRLSFVYVIRQDDTTDDGVLAIRLVLDGATIRDNAGNTADTAFSEKRSESFRISAPPPPDWIEVDVSTVPLRLLLVQPGRYSIPDDVLNKWPLYADNKAYGRPTTIVIAEPFYIGSTEVTLRDFFEVLEYLPGKRTTLMDVPLPDDPVWRTSATNVPWLDAIRFCNALSEREGLRPCYLVEDAAGAAVKVSRISGDGFRLPLPDEWIYACLTKGSGDAPVLNGMTSSVMEWSDIEPGAQWPFKHGGHSAEKRAGPIFLLRQDWDALRTGFRIARDAAPKQPMAGRP